MASNSDYVDLRKVRQKRSFDLTAWHVAAIKILRERLPPEKRRQVSENMLARKAIELLVEHFDEAMFVDGRKPTVYERVLFSTVKKAAGKPFDENGRGLLSGSRDPGIPRR
ncbi:MAG: hypothetical protein HN975_08670 [Anaerolineae bacterium]|jgi:hypothetical protein|nr:hypothetical protein [Anaerolineae bacterium]